MKKKVLASVFGLFLIFGLSGLASAAMVSDSAGDELLTDFDILKAKIQPYPAYETAAGAPCKKGTAGCLPIDDIPEYLKVSIEMDSKLGGGMILELDVDDDTTTGSTSGMCSMASACLTPGTKIKPGVEGLDISLYIAFDDQDSEGVHSWCYNCFGTQGNCYYKEEFCTGCGGVDCYKADPQRRCAYGDLNCWLSGNTCQPSGQPECDTCFDFVLECPAPSNCGDGRYRGEWFVVTLDPPQQSAPYYERGRVDTPLPPLGGPNGTENKACFDLPYKRIVDRLSQYGPGGGTFDYELAKSPENLKWSMCMLEDGVAGGNDYLSVDPFCMNAVDAIPNSGTAAAADGGTHACVGDLNNDGSVSGTDTNVYKADYPRSDFLNAPCPNCK